MAVGTADAALHLGGLDTSAPGVEAQVTRLIAVAAALVARHAPEAPEAVADQATLQCVAFLWHARGGNIAGRGRRPNALVESGARQLLAPWRQPSHARTSS